MGILSFKGINMKAQKKLKHISQKLNQKQLDAIHHAQEGSYLPLISCCLDCHKAISKCYQAVEMGAVRWGEKTIQHYVDLCGYLESFLTDHHAFKQYQKALQQLDK